MTIEPDTIAAVATAGGRGGIGIVKISGSDACGIAGAVFRPINPNADMIAGSTQRDQGQQPFEFESHRLYYGHIVDVDKGALLDEVLLSVMKAPHTYTREDVVEINAHGGAVAVHAILQLVLSKGARLADPGEFTRRAFLNGRIDLTQAEAVIDVINARTRESLELAAAQLSGKLGERVASIRNRLIDILTRVDAAIDFPEDVEEFLEADRTVKQIKSQVLEPLKDLVRNYVDAHVFRDGLTVAVVGRPNVGKSSLLNQLLQKDRAIVTEVPGTTRDVIEDTLNLNGIPVILSDTAGVHHADNPIEIIGIEKTLEHVNGSDLVLFMIEAHRPLQPADHHIYQKIQSKSRIMVLNKIDLIKKGSETVLPANWTFDDRACISALYNRGLDRLKEKISKLIRGQNPIELNEVVVPNLRHKLLLAKCIRAAEAIIEKIYLKTPSDLLAIDIQEAVDVLGIISGENIKVDVLEQIFSRFCVGK